MTFLAGAAEVVITPPVGTPLDGYGGRVGGAIGVHDDLHARAIVVDDGATQAAIVSCDLIGVDRRLVAAARERASSATGIPPEHIMIAATHTHAGPAGLRRDLDGALSEVTARTIAGAIEAAHRSSRAAIVKVGAGSVDSVSQNRRDPDGARDEVLRVLLFDSPDRPIGAVVNYACHPTVLFSTNMLISADYPGHAVRTVQHIVGDGPVLFLNGACGDVNPAWIEQRHDEAYRVGSIVGAEAARRLQELRPLGAQHKVWNIRWDELTNRDVTSGELLGEPRIRVVSRTVDVPLRELEPPDAYERRIANLQRELGPAAREGLAHEGEIADATPHDEQRRSVMAQMTRYRTERAVAERLGPGAGGHVLHPEIQAIAFGARCAVLGLPGEFFAETGAAIQRATAVPHLLLACYANHYAGYFVPAHAFEEGGYEPGVTVLDESAEETTRNAAIELVREATAAP